jgi:glycosyltransferase involved in cell wall biosynthesis
MSNKNLYKIVHVSRIGGHHSSFIDLFSKLFDMKSSVGKISFKNSCKLINSTELLFATLDDDIFGFLYISLARSFLGKKTVALFLSPHSCFLPGWRSYLKKTLFKMIKLFPRVSVFSFLPFEAAPHLTGVATASVHDPQLWDLLSVPPDIDQKMISRVHGIARGRPVLVFLGTVALEKGIDRLAEILQCSPNLSEKICVIIAGRVNKNCKNQVNICVSHGATLWDRRVSDEEMASLYVASELVWVCYNSNYDQASGIFGRAVQHSRRPVINEQATIVGYYSKILNINEIRLPEDPIKASKILIKSMSDFKNNSVFDINLLENWKNEFIYKIKRGLDSKHE